MKTPKLKAIELVDAMSLTYEVNGDYIYQETSKLCALICCDEVLNNLEDYIGEDIAYWNEVKNEIKKL
jgi:hypothetical protein